MRSRWIYGLAVTTTKTAVMLESDDVCFNIANSSLRLLFVENMLAIFLLRENNPVTYLLALVMRPRKCTWSFNFQSASMLLSPMWLMVYMLRWAANNGANKLSFAATNPSLYNTRNHFRTPRFLQILARICIWDHKIWSTWALSDHYIVIVDKFVLGILIKLIFVPITFPERCELLGLFTVSKNREHCLVNSEFWFESRINFGDYLVKQNNADEGCFSVSPELQSGITIQLRKFNNKMIKKLNCSCLTYVSQYCYYQSPGNILSERVSCDIR